MKNNQLATFYGCKIIKETDGAILVKFEDKEKEQWIPKSLIHDNSEIWIEGDKGVLVVPEWFAIKEGLI